MNQSPFGGDPWAKVDQNHDHDHDHHRDLDLAMGGGVAADGGIHDIIADLLPAPAGGGEGAAAILQALAEELRTRFAQEEELMRERGYPRFLEHAAAHAAFLSELCAARAVLRRQGLTPQLSRWFAAGCGAWLRAHGRSHDRALAHHLSRIAWARALRRAGLPAARPLALPTVVVAPLRRAG